MTQPPANNDRFLEAIFGRANLPNTFTVSFRGPMETANWSRNPFCSDPLANNYFCISTLIDPAGRRTPENCRALHVLLVDDVGTKVPIAKPAGILGQPSYRIETSPGNEQWGYILDPPDQDPLHAEALVRAMTQQFTADAAGRNRVARLPYGTNGKNGHTTRLLFWQPTITMTPEQAFTMLEATPVTTADTTYEGALPIDQDPTIKAMELANHPFEATGIAGIYKVQCPWVAEHTNGRDDGAAYISPAGFNCFHGHCNKKTFADFRSFLGLSASEVDGAIADAAFGVKVEAIMDKNEPLYAALADSDAGDEAAQQQGSAGGQEKPPHPWLAERASEFADPSGRFMTRTELQAAYPIEWLFEGIVPMGIPWCIAGEGGLGKSRIMMSLCMSIASGVPWGNDFIPGEKAGAPVVFLTQEDDKPQRGHRFITQYEYLCERDPRWDSDDIRERLQRNLYMPSLDWGQQLTAAFRADFKNFLSQMPVPPALVVFDPMVLFWDHTDKDSNINSAAGAVNTMRTLLRMVRGEGDRSFSVAVCHHISKEGEVYGSAILTANLRLVFTVAVQETGAIGMKVVKVNSSNIAGKVYEIDRSTDGSAAVYPSIPFEFEKDIEQKLAGLIHSGAINWDVPASKLIDQAMKTSEFSDRSALEKLITPNGVWHKGTLDSIDRLAKLGLVHGKNNRYAPMPGYSGEES